MSDYSKTIDLEKGLQRILDRIDTVANKLQNEKEEQETKNKQKEEEK